MNALTIEALGFTREELQQRIVDQACEQLMTSVTYNPDADSESTVESQLSRDLRAAVRKQVDARITAIADEHILPRVTEMLETITLQETNRWGEATGKPLTFREYLVQRAESYLTEKVDFNGKSKVEAGGYSWSGTQTRVAHLVHQHLHYSIESAMKQAMASANSAIASGIAETVKLKLAEVAAKLRVDVKAGG